MIAMNDFKAEPQELSRQELEAVERVLQSGWFILGKELQTFEQEWARYCGTRFAIGVGNGMDALEIGLRALNIGSGDEVITTPMTAAASVMAIIRAGATPVLADIDPKTALLDIKSVERCVTAKTKAVLLVHLYGQLSEMLQWKSFCDARSIVLLEDCAQAHGAVSSGTRAGALGMWGAYSFYPTKNLGARGDGGAIVTNSEEVATQARLLRNYGQEKRYVHSVTGLNSRLDEVQAAILSTRLRWLDVFNKRRQEVAQTYFRSISNPRIQLLSPPADFAAHVFHLFVVRCEERAELVAHLKAHDIETLIHYPVAMHEQCFAKSVVMKPIALPCTEAHAGCCLSLPCHPQLRAEDVTKVVACLNRF